MQSQKTHQLRSDVVEDLFSQLPEHQRVWKKIENEVGVKRQARINWLNGKHRIKDAHARRLATLLGTTIDKIVLTDEEDDNLNGVNGTAIVDQDYDAFKQPDDLAAIVAKFQSIIGERWRINLTYVGPGNSIIIRFHTHRIAMLRLMNAFMRGELKSFGITSITVGNQFLQGQPQQGETSGDIDLTRDKFKDQLRQALESLTPQERRIAKKLVGYPDFIMPCSKPEAALIFNVSEDTVKEIENKLVDKLRELKQQQPTNQQTLIPGEKPILDNPSEPD